MWLFHTKYLAERLAFDKLQIVLARGYKTYFMLNSAEHEIFFAKKYENAKINWHFHIY